MAPDTRIFALQPHGTTLESRVRNNAFNSENEATPFGAENSVSRGSGHGNANDLKAHSGACPAVSQGSGHTRATDVSGPLKGGPSGHARWWPWKWCRS
jgi:hypothetical protein